MSYKILTLDGGGIRGLLTAVLLERLFAKYPDVINKIDLVAGTSTGGILALGLAAGKSPSDLRQLYYQKGNLIFDNSWIKNLQDLNGLAGAKYDNKNLKAILTQVFQGKTLGQLSKKVLIPSFNLDNKDGDPNMRSWTPKFFHNFNGPDSDADVAAADAALYTSAAPTYFPSAGSFVDGGVVANNPSISALCQALDPRKSNPSEIAKLEDVVILSLGTGKNQTYIAGNNLDWGITQWGVHLVNIFTDGVGDVSDYECQQILRDRYCRVEAYFPASITFPMDDVSKLDALIAFAENVNLDSAISWISKYWQ